MYTPGQLVELLHQVPHVNISLHSLEDTSFRPDSELYLESLGLVGAVPLSCLLLTLTMVSTFLLCRGRPSNEKVKKIREQIFIRKLLTSPKSKTQVPGSLVLKWGIHIWTQGCHI